MSVAPDTREIFDWGAAITGARRWRASMATPAFDNAAFADFVAWVLADPRHGLAFGVASGRVDNGLPPTTMIMPPMLSPDVIAFEPADATQSAGRLSRDIKMEDETAAARLRDEAIAWMRRLGGPDYTDRVQAEFMAWIHADPAHELAFREASLRGLPPARAAEPVGVAEDPIAPDAGDEPPEPWVAERCALCGQTLHETSDSGVIDLNPPPPHDDPALLAEASEWVESLASGASPTFYQDLRAWLRGDPRRRAAYAQALSNLATAELR